MGEITADQRSKYLTVKEAARRLNKTEQEVRELCRAGSLPGSFKKSKKGVWFIPLSAITSYDELKASKPQQHKLNSNRKITRVSIVGIFLFLFALISAIADLSSASSQLRNWSQTLGIGLPFPKARDDEILLIVADFSGDTSVDADIRIFRELRERISESKISGVRIEKYDDQVPITEQEATQIGQIYYATIVIWGTVDAVGIEPRYTVIKNKEYITSQPNLGITLAADFPTFSAYVAEGAPKEFEYLMLFSVGQIAYFSKDYQRAITLFNDAVRIDLGTRSRGLDLETVYYYRGFAHRALDELPEALDDFSSAIKINELNPVFFSARGSIRNEMGSYDSAMEDHNRAISLDPSEAGYYVNLGNTYSYKEELSSAIEMYDKAINLNPMLAIAYLNRGIVYQKQGNGASSLSDYDYAIQLESNFAAAYYNRGMHFYVRKQMENAISDFTKALENGWTLAFVYYYRGDSYHALKRYEDALRDYNSALEIDPEFTVVYNNRGNVYHSLNDLDAALVDLSTAIELNPEYALVGHLA